MSHRRVSLIISLFSLLALISLVGCGGGGGGGGAVFTPIGGGFTPIAPLGVAPAGFSSIAFPATEGQSQLSIANFANGSQTTVLLANNSLSPVTVQVSANTVVPTNLTANVQSAVSENRVRSKVPGASFFARLRERERLAPRFSFPAASSVLANQAIRADELNTVLPFSVINASTDEYATVQAKCYRIVDLEAPGGNVNFFVEESLLSDPDVLSRVDKYALAFPEIYRTVRSVFGSEPPNTFNSLGSDVTILIVPSSNIGDDLIAGYFYSNDLYSAANSNVRKMFYMNANKALSDNTMISTLAHEFQHMVNFYQRKLNDLSEETWLNEAMSGYAEHVCGYKISNQKNGSKCDQVKDFLAKPHEVALVKDSGWGTVTDPVVNEHYGQAYLFGSWLAQHYGTSLGGDRYSVAGLLSSKSVGVAALTNFCGEGCDIVFARFITALYVNNASNNSKYGWKDIDLFGDYTFEDYAAINLNGVKSITESNVTQGFSSGNITLVPYSSAYIVLSGGDGNTLRINIPTTMTVLELTK